MADIYTTTIEGEMLDLICYRHYGGRQRGAVEQVLAANPGRPDLRTKSHLPAGTKLVLPNLPDPVMAAPLQNLWD